MYHLHESAGKLKEPNKINTKQQKADKVKNFLGWRNPLGGRNERPTNLLVPIIVQPEPVPDHMWFHPITFLYQLIGN
jgi:hypothetical protein